MFVPYKMFPPFFSIAFAVAYTSLCALSYAVTYTVAYAVAYSSLCVVGYAAGYAVAYAATILNL